jgi:DNA-binding HxlR family transcriptional regulator
MTPVLAAPPNGPDAARTGEQRFARYLEPGTCAILRDTFDRIGDKWTLLVVAHLALGPRRFGELRRGIEGISQRMLTLTLRRLERDGIVVRTQYPEIPPRVDYRLSPFGSTLVETVASMADWALAYQPAIDAHRARFDQAQAGGADDGSDVPDEDGVVNRPGPSA